MAWWGHSVVNVALPRAFITLLVGSDRDVLQLCYVKINNLPKKKKKRKRKPLPFQQTQGSKNVHLKLLSLWIYIQNCKKKKV